MSSETQKFDFGEAYKIGIENVYASDVGEVSVEYLFEPSFLSDKNVRIKITLQNRNKVIDTGKINPSLWNQFDTCYNLLSFMNSMASKNQINTLIEENTFWRYLRESFPYHQVWEQKIWKKNISFETVQRERSQIVQGKETGNVQGTYKLDYDERSPFDNLDNCLYFSDTTSEKEEEKDEEEVSEEEVSEEVSEEEVSEEEVSEEEYNIEEETLNEVLERCLTYRKGDCNYKCNFCNSRLTRKHIGSARHRTLVRNLLVSLQAETSFSRDNLDINYTTLHNMWKKK